MGNTHDEASKSFKVKVATKQIEGERTITAVVSSNKMDRDYEYVDVPSLRLPLKGGGYVRASDLTGNEQVDLPMLLNHSFDVEDVVGSVRKAYLNEMNELVVEFGMSKRPKAQDLMTLIDEGHLDNAFSITMSDYDYENSTIYNAEVIEISLVFRGSNKDARILAVKSLKKESEMSEVDKTKDVEQTPVETPEIEAPAVEELAEVEVAEVEEVETKETPEAVETDEVEAEAEAEVETEEVEVAEEDEAIAESESKSIKKETTKMAEHKEIAVKQVKDAPVVDAAETAKKKMSERELKVLTVKQIQAMLQKDHAKVAELNKIAMENDDADVATKAWKQKLVSYDDGAGVSLYLAEQLDRDVDAQYGDFGNVGTIVRRITLTDSPKYRRIVRTEGVVFTKPGFDGTKTEDEPTWTSFTLEPKPFAVIVGWNDHVAEDAYIAMYDEIVRDIAEAQARLEDTIILTEAGATTADGTVYPASGLVEILDGVVAQNETFVYDSTIVTALASGYGKINSSARNNLSLVINGADWAKLALIQDQEGRPLWTVNGQNVALGALGNIRVVTSDVLPAGTFILGNFQNYVLAEKEGLQLFESRHAVVGSVNAFTDDATFLRAVKRLEGGTPRTNAFVLFTEATS